MRLLRDFKCDECGNEVERFIDSEVMEIDCDCGFKAQKVIGLPTIQLEGISGDFPGAYHHWADIREKKARKHKREE